MKETAQSLEAPVVDHWSLPPPRMNGLGKVAVAVVAVLLVFGILEVAARVYAHVASQDRLIVIDNVVGWKLSPNAHRRYDKETQPYFIAINSKGLRDVEHSYDKPAGVYRIVVIGDSFVFGAGGVEPSKRFADILQASTKNTEVINMGVPAYGTDQEYLYLANEAMRYHPDLVLVCAFYNDFSESFSTINPSNGRPKGYFSLDGDQLVFHPPAFSIFYRMAQHSYLLGMARHGLEQDLQCLRQGDAAEALGTEFEDQTGDLQAALCQHRRLVPAARSGPGAGLSPVSGAVRKVGDSGRHERSGRDPGREDARPDGDCEAGKSRAARLL